MDSKKTKFTESKASISYNKLWKLLIDKKMKKGDLQRETGMSPNTVAKLGKDEMVSLDAIIRICQVLECDIGDVMEIKIDRDKT
ncbi:helix-turn-helix domain-containing protein [Butyrivibrio sp. AC2005]|uniref:helix-turn-helix domain-containing protein n=1 Tax=Butyrivibrio sp. AC2005 TaxID=1280672 RepID=UPI0003F4F9CB|nr:helix-turn-helix transcriptional regulator [Butyrivibrio sp. AC2005]